MLTDAEIREKYVTPGDPSAFGGVTLLSNLHNISQEKAKDIVAGIDSYTRHREFKKPKVYNPYFIREQRQQIQCDLIDMQQLANHNDQIKYLLIFIDSFTRKVWVSVLKNKTGQHVANAFKRWFSRPEIGGFRPRQIFCDRGTELKNEHVRNVLRQKRVPMIHPNSHIKAAIVERANRSLQNIIYKYMTERETFRYIDKLPDLVKTYNTRPHRSIDHLSPNEAERPENAARVLQAQEKHFDESRLASNRQKAVKYRIGNIVRIARLPDRFKRGYQEQANQEYFTIQRISQTMPIPMYFLQSMNTNEIIRGGFYANEITLVKPDSVYKVERVLRRRRRNGQRQFYVKWLHFGAQHNSWINENDLVDDYRRV